MKRRWVILIAIGVGVTVVDQWTKFLVVKHLTPGIAQAHAPSKAPISTKEKESILRELSLTDQLGYFYGGVDHPCRSFGARCPTARVVTGFWNWRYVENPGAAWGLLAGANEKYRVPFFLVVSIAAMAFIIRFFRKLDDDQYLMIVSLSLVFGGAIGNFIDRLHLSYVIDFIDWYVGSSHWPTFNFADAAISTGVALLILEWIKDAVANRAKETSSTPEESSA